MDASADQVLEYQGGNQQAEGDGQVEVAPALPHPVIFQAEERDQRQGEDAEDVDDDPFPEKPFRAKQYPRHPANFRL